MKMQGEACLPFRNPSNGRGVWAAAETAHSARGTLAYSRRLGSSHPLAVSTCPGALKS
jgi:hypothetical protein